MRTISPPKKRFKTCTFTCKSCEAVMEATTRDGVHEHDKDGQVVVFKCPHCQTPNWVSLDAFELKETL